VGLVVNEALAFGLPIIASNQIGATDALIRNMINGYVVELGSVTGIAFAMADIASSKERWEELSRESQNRGWLADTERFADAVELMVFPDAQPALERITAFKRELRLTAVRQPPFPVRLTDAHKKPAGDGGLFHGLRVRCDQRGSSLTPISASSTARAA
jgi:hypothetical protein